MSSIIDSPKNQSPVRLHPKNQSPIIISPKNQSQVIITPKNQSAKIMSSKNQSPIIIAPKKQSPTIMLEKQSPDITESSIIILQTTQLPKNQSPIQSTISSPILSIITSSIPSPIMIPDFLKNIKLTSTYNEMTYEDLKKIAFEHNIIIPKKKNRKILYDRIIKYILFSLNIDRFDINTAIKLNVTIPLNKHKKLLRKRIIKAIIKLFN